MVINLPDRTVSHADWCEKPIEFPAKHVYSPASSIVMFVKYNTSTSDMFKVPVCNGKPKRVNTAVILVPHLAFWKVPKANIAIPWQPWRRVCHQARTGYRSSQCASATECAAVRHCRPCSGIGRLLRPPLLYWLVDQLVIWVCEESVLKWKHYKNVLEGTKQLSRSFPNQSCPVGCFIQLNMLNSNANHIRCKTGKEISTASKSWRHALIGSIRESQTQVCVLWCFEVTESIPPLIHFFTETKSDPTPNCHRSGRNLARMPSQLLIQKHTTQAI